MNPVHVLAQIVSLRGCGHYQGGVWLPLGDGVPIRVTIYSNNPEEVVVGGGGEDGEICPPFSPLGVEGGEAVARLLARVGACAAELRLMGGERYEEPTTVGRAGCGKGSLSKKVPRACGTPTIERMRSGH